MNPNYGKRMRIQSPVYYNTDKPSSKHHGRSGALLGIWDCWCDKPYAAVRLDGQGPYQCEITNPDWLIYE